MVGLNHAQLGELDAALEAETRARVIGETVGDRQLQASALSATGIVHVGLGETEAAIEACQKGLAVAPDPLTRAVVSGWLGFAFTEHGDAMRAIPALETAVQQHGVFHFPQFLGWFTAFLADAYRRDGRVERALETAREALQITRAARSPYGVGLALRALGRAQLAAGAWSDAAATLHEAGAAFEAIQARYDAARAWMDLGAAASETGDRETAAEHWGQARRRFVELHLPKWAARADALVRTVETPA